MPTTGAAPSARPSLAGADDCPVVPVVDLVFSRWTTPVLWVLAHDGPQRFTDIRRRLAPVTAKVLTARLRQLERDGLVHRASTEGVLGRSSYTITDLGRSLTPAFALLASWGTSNMALVESAREQYDRSGRPRPA